MKKQYLIGGAIAAVALIGAGVAGAATVKKPNSLAAEIAAKFHLNQSDVQAAIDQHKAETQNYLEQAYQQRLDTAVSSGRITKDQESKILAKHQEIVSFLATLKEKSPQDRRTALRTEFDQVRTWAQANNLPLNLIFGGLGHHRGMGMMGPSGQTQSINQTPDQPPANSI